jgi:hypothetical protein
MSLKPHKVNALHCNVLKFVIIAMHCTVISQRRHTLFQMKITDIILSEQLWVVEFHICRTYQQIADE